MVSTSGLTCANARTSASRAGVRSAPSFAVRVRGGTVGVSRAGEAASLCPPPGGVKDASVSCLGRPPGRNWGRSAVAFRPGQEVSVVRKPVVLITGASGEIGHGLIESLSRDGPAAHHHPRPEAPRARPRRARAAAVRGLDPRRQPARAHPVGVRGGPRLPPGGAPLDPGRVHAHDRAPGQRRGDAPNCWSSRRRRASRTGGPSSSSTPARSPPTACPTSRRRPAPAGWARTTGTSPPPCTAATSSTASTSGATTPGTTSSSRRRRCRARWTSARVRFPGLISAVTVPSGGTSDYAPEMLHAAAQGKPYACFVRPDTRIPFMAMPDGVEALLRLAAAPTASADADGLQRRGLQPVGRGDPRRACSTPSRARR